MKPLLLVFSFLIVYGSLFPFQIDPKSYDPAMLDSLLYFGLNATGRGDLIANILLFVPFGLLAINIGTTRATSSRFILVLVAGFALAFLVQVPQLVIPGRVPSGSDAIWNLVGCAIGCLVGLSPISDYLKRFAGTTKYPPIPVALALLWLLFGLAPFIPSIDLQLLKDNIKTLFVGAPSFVWTFQSVTMWLVVFHFLQKSSSRFLAEKHFPAIVAIFLSAGFFIVGNNVSLEKIIAGIVAIPLWFLIRKSYSPTWLALALFLTIAGISFTPFTLRESPTEFHWIPFAGALTGNIFINTLAVFKKLILYGSLIWLLVECRFTLRSATFATAIYLFFSEYLQVFFISSTPEITDPLLAIIIGITFDQYRLRTQQAPLKSADADHSAREIQQAKTATPAPEGGVSSSYIPGMDGLRAIAALAVFFVHFNQQVGLQNVAGPFDLERLLSNGNTGVALFFVLSGLLLSLPFWESKLGRRPAPSINGYAWRRAGRILPAYYLCLFTILAAKSVMGSGTSWNNILSHLIFVYNVSDWNILSLNQPFWTLAVEAQFYVILPLLFLALRRTSATTATTIFLLLIPALYLVNDALVTLIRERATFPVKQLLIWPFSLYLSGPNSFVLTYSTLGHLPHFLIGVITARLFLHVLDRRDVGALKTGIFDALFWIGSLMVFLVLATPLDDVLQVPHGRYNFPFVPVLLAAIVLSVPFSRSARAVLSLRVAAWLGAISYGIYIYHYPLQKVIGKAMKWMELPVSEHAVIFAIASLAATLLCSQASYTLVELPAMRWVRRHLKSRKALSSDRATKSHTETVSVDPPKPAESLSVAKEQLSPSEPAQTAALLAEPSTERHSLEINLHQYQYDYLQHIANGTGQNVSALCEAIVMLNSSGGQDNEDAIRALKAGANFSVDRDMTGWTSASLSLDSPQFQTLKLLGSKFGRSESYILRHLIEAQIKEQRGLALQLQQLFTTHGFLWKFAQRHRVLAIVSLLLVAIATLFLTRTASTGASIVSSPAWAGRDSNIIFDHHAHTRFSDGALTPAALIELGSQHGCTAMAVTDHSYSPSAASEQQLADIQLLRRQNPELLLVAGIELNMPSYEGREHVSVIVAPELESTVLRTLGNVAEMSISQAQDNKSENVSDASTLYMMSKLHSEQKDLIVIYNHPSRKVQDINESLEDILRWDSSRELFTAIEGAPGHQNLKTTGSYETKILPENRWDPVVARVGGAWDQLLDRGYNIWGALASSDYHNSKMDRPPCEFARTHVTVGEKSYSGLIQALKAGTFWADHGRILDEFHFSIELEGLSQNLYPGSVARLGSDKGMALATISVVRGPGSMGSPLTVEIISNCASGKTEVTHTSVLPAGVGDDTVFLPVYKNGSDGQSCFIRARVSLHNPTEPDLMAYTNPLRILL